MPKVSVIIPVYNTEKYLRKCLDSVCNQTLSDIEVICINDCSLDNSLGILQEYAQKDKRIKIIDFKENKGAAVARNTGIDEAQGEYIGFVDSDDFVDLDFYEKLYTKAIQENADIVKGKLYLYDLNNNRKYLESWININDAVKKNNANFYFTFTTAIYKLNFVNKYNIRFLEGLIHFEDPYFTIKANLYIDKVEVLDNAIYYYTNNPNSSSRGTISLEHANSMAKGASQVIDMLNSSNVDIAHYKIVFNFVVNQLLCWCNKLNCKNELNIISADGLLCILEKCKYRKECVEFYFIEKKQFNRLQMVEKLRSRLKDNK